MNEQEKFDQWESRIRIVERYVKNYTFPIYTSDGKNFELFGSSVGISISGDDYICTANHLIEEVLKTNSDVVIGVNGMFEALNMDSVIFIKKESVDYDICLVKIKNNPAHVQYLDQMEFYQGDKFNNGSWQYLQGYPISKNKNYDIHDHENEKITTAYLKTAIKVDQSVEHPFRDVSAKTHLFFKYNEAVYKKEGNTIIESKKRQNMLGLKGCSGCGIRHIYDITINLAGIFTQLKTGMGAGTKAICMLDLNNWHNM